MLLPGVSSHLLQQPSPALDLADLLRPIFQRLFHQSHELVGDGTVDEAVIVSERQVDDGADGDQIVALFIRDNQRLLGDAAHTDPES
jgi:hypothetical protein